MNHYADGREQMESYKVDRSGWPAGPWDSEPDRVEWKDEATGLPCLIVRNAYQGFLCGYVAVAPGHPWHGKSYEDVDADVHGGLTYADSCHGNICHVPAQGEPDNVHWFGFDCAHAWDLSPNDIARRHTLYEDEFYRTVEYAKGQCARLAAQIQAAA